MVTSDFHMQRSRAIFRKFFGLAERSLGCSFALGFHAASDQGVFAPEVLAAREERERASTAVSARALCEACLPQSPAAAE